MPVAKSYTDLPQVCDPYSANGKMYVKVKMKNGNTKQVRWYTDQEYAKLYPTEAKDACAMNQKKALGFEKGYITILKGEAEICANWLSDHGARYARWWGWYFPSTEIVPDVVSVGLTPVTLSWDLVGLNTNLRPEDQVKQAIDSLLFVDSPSEHIGRIGERIEIDVTVTKIVPLEGSRYGTQYLFEMADEKENVYIWITSTQKLTLNEKCHLRGTVKEHSIYRNVKQTVLTRCAK